MASEHFGFIFAAYAATVVVVVGMIGAIVFDHRALQRALARMAAQTQSSEGKDR